MANYNFKRDLEESKRGVKVAADFFSTKLGAEIRELPKVEQHKGDFECAGVFVEVKFDLMAARTNNLCFEVDNGKKATGILATEADKIVYVVPYADNSGFKLYVFSRANLLNYLKDPSSSGKFRLVRGGDNHKFGMILVSLDQIVSDNVAEEVVECLITITSVKSVKS